MYKTLWVTLESISLASSLSTISPRHGGFSRIWLIAWGLRIFLSSASHCRKSDTAVDMDEMMAAMVLTSLSCSPVVQSPTNSDASVPGKFVGRILR